LAEKGVLTDAPESAVYRLQEIFTDLQLQIEMFEVERAYQEKLELLNSLKLVGSDDIKSVKEHLDALSEQVNHYTTQVQRYNNESARYTAELKRLQQFNATCERIRRIIRDKTALARTKRESIRRITYNQLVRDIQSELAVCEQRIGVAAQQKTIVSSLEKQVATYAANESVLAIVVKELSPTEGIIAEGMIGFMNGFIEQMNSIIRAVWSYKLEIQSCRMIDGETVDLDYKFPMRVQNAASGLVSDVSKGSSGMLEIINLAFKIAAMRCLGLENAPLILDELGAAMDVQHKYETVQIIKALVEQRTFPQVFFISHDFAQYGGLANCQIALLNGINVVAPTGAQVNKHVTMA
jgi:DNA repair exonuclease SbcCD ATPase subunit